MDKKRCINLDWLEVHCTEASEHYNAEYYKRWYKVVQRQYGTPQYAEMFTLFEHGKPFLEIRRKPYSIKGEGGIFMYNSCHLRLTNNALYGYKPVERFMDFCKEHNYIINNISRIDICMDFNEFDYVHPDDAPYEDIGIRHPARFIAEYFKKNIMKINQTNISAHGKSSWDTITINSVKWGSLKSNVSTKLYNKTQEMRESHQKQYIQAIWQQCGLDVDDVWRLEFSIKNTNGWLSKDGELLDNNIELYANDTNLQTIFKSLAAHYFHFKRPITLSNGHKQRKDRCPDIPLFDFDLEIYVKPMHIPEVKVMNRTEKMIVKYLNQLKKDAPLKVQRNAISDTAYYVRFGFPSHEKPDLIDMMPD